MVRGGAAPEGLDDDHAAAAAGTRVGERLRLATVGGGILAGLAWRRHGEQFTGTRDVVDTRAAGEQAVMADAVEAVGQHVDEEAADELGGRERHRLEAFAPVEAVVLPPEGDAVAVARDQAAVGDGD